MKTSMKKKDRCIFPAVFFRDEDKIGVYFPNLPGCVTQGDDMDNALAMAKDALEGHLLSLEDTGQPIPEPTPFYELNMKKGEVVVLVDAHLSLAREEEANRAINKTVTLPNWMNIAAMDAGINFSSTLQDAIREKLGV